MVYACCTHMYIDNVYGIPTYMSLFATYICSLHIGWNRYRRSSELTAHSPTSWRRDWSPPVLWHLTQLRPHSLCLTLVSLCLSIALSLCLSDSHTNCVRHRHLTRQRADLRHGFWEASRFIWRGRRGVRQIDAGGNVRQASLPPCRRSPCSGQNAQYRMQISECTVHNCLTFQVD